MIESHRVHKTGWLRASVLGANDGIVSTACLLLGVAAADASQEALLVAGLAAVVAGALSMGVGEYVAVSSQRDVENADLELERRELAEDPEDELVELTAIYVSRGLSSELAHQVATELTAHDAFAAHARDELNLDPDELAQPIQAAFASAVAFTVGAALPLGAVLLAPSHLQAIVIVGSALAALAALGSWSAKLGAAPQRPAVARVVIGGSLAMALSVGIGWLTGMAV
ncbi:MAG: VIT family protein [Proteobacteria bacterium]|nr:VIT family protein [Pseudomonadota bacterium]